MINVHNISVSFAGEYLFEAITFQIKAGDRIGLVGKNGAGKSTMLKLLSGDISPDEGSIAKDKEISIGFLRQDIDFELGRTVLEEAYQAFTNIKKLEEEIEHINQYLSESNDYESADYHEAISLLSEKNHLFEIHGGYQYAGETEKVLLGLGFKRTDFDKKVETFSGGWRMRIELAKLLLQKHDLLLLDEPTNHLDIESILWLENFLTTFPGAVVLVSHDKMFLDQVTNRTIEISLGQIYDIPKPYSKYLSIRQEQKVLQLAAQKNQAKKIEETEKLIEKFRYKASKASMAQSLIKKLDKIERIEVDEDDLSQMKIKFPDAQTPGKIVLTIENVTKTFDSNTIFRNLNIEIERGAKWAFVGQNGQGKSTLLKAIMQEFDYEGNIKLGHQVQIGYFAQNQAEYLDGEKTILDTMLDAATDANRSKVRDLLGSFLFRGDDVEKKVKVLSGGERNRLALCMLLLKPINLLLMDEPTNHLDITSKNVLKEALKNYSGTLIIVSHDRDFLDGLSDKVLEFKDQKIKTYLGDINFFLEQKNQDDMRALEKDYVATPKEESVKATKSYTYEEQKQRKTLQNKLNKTEAEITRLEKWIANADIDLAEKGNELLNDKAWWQAYQQHKTLLEKALIDWEDIALALDAD